MEINTCEQYVLANLRQTLKQLDEASAEIESLKKQLYDARDSPLAIELRIRGGSSLFNSGLRYNREVFRDGVLLDFDVWVDAVVNMSTIDEIMTKVKCSNKDKCVMLPETGAYFIKQQAAAAWNTRSDNA